MSRSRLPFLLLFIVAVGVAGCADKATPVPTAPTTVTASSAANLSPLGAGDLHAPSGVPQAASGTYSVAGASFLSRRALPNACFIEMNLTIALQGTFEGSLTAHVTMFSRGACPEAGTADELHGQGTFVGTVHGAEGTLRVEFRARHSADAIAEFRVVSLTGDEGLSGLHAVLTGTGVQGGGGTYEGQFHFDPQVK